MERRKFDAFSSRAVLLIATCLTLLLSRVSSAEMLWDHVVNLDENYQLLWKVREPDIVFEVQVRTRGYVGFGFSRDGTIYGADIFIGWIDNGHTFFHDCHIKTHSSSGEPVPDASQDYVLLSSSENATHTNLRFRRKLNTCDEKFDVPITTDTMNIIFLYHPEKPKRGQITRGSLSDSVFDMRPVRSLLLLQKSPQGKLSRKQEVKTFDIRVKEKKLPQLPNKMLKWCHFHKLTNVSQNHMIRYEPKFSSSESKRYISFMRIYECKSAIDEEDQECTNTMKTDQKCFTTVAIWSQGSEGFTYPKNVGYPLNADSVMIEIHYQPVDKSYQRSIFDSSGFRIFHTPERRKYDAGVMTVGIEPNYLHVLAPGFKRVISVGHCTSNCTKKALPEDGISVFGVNMQTHSLGRKIKIGVVRNGEELAPIARESNLNSDYIENRILSKVSRIMPGDHVTVECTYNTYERDRFTLGGDSDDEEVCMAALMYYPRQEQLVSCNSQTNIKNLFRALGIEKLSKSGDFLIVSPKKYANRTLERHLQLYDWRNEYDTFDRTIKSSSFGGICNSAYVSSSVYEMPANIVKPFTSMDTMCPTQDINTNSVYKYADPSSNDIDKEGNAYADNGRGKVTRHSPTYSLELSSSSSKPNGRLFSLAIAIIVVVSELKKFM